MSGYVASFHAAGGWLSFFCMGLLRSSSQRSTSQDQLGLLRPSVDMLSSLHTLKPRRDHGMAQSCFGARLAQRSPSMLGRSRALGGSRERPGPGSCSTFPKSDGRLTLCRTWKKLQAGTIGSLRHLHPAPPIDKNCSEN